MDAFIKPLDGLTVRSPKDMSSLPPEGALVSLDGVEGKYWRRRINDGSVIVVEPKKEIKKPIKKKIGDGGKG